MYKLILRIVYEYNSLLIQIDILPINDNVASSLKFLEMKMRKNSQSISFGNNRNPFHDLKVAVVKLMIVC